MHEFISGSVLPRPQINKFSLEKFQNCSELVQVQRLRIRELTTEIQNFELTEYEKGKTSPCQLQPFLEGYFSHRDLETGSNFEQTNSVKRKRKRY